MNMKPITMWTNLLFFKVCRKLLPCLSMLICTLHLHISAHEPHCDLLPREFYRDVNQRHHFPLACKTSNEGHQVDSRVFLHPSAPNFCIML